MEFDANLFKHLVENLFDGVIQLDTNGRVVIWNKGTERITGYRSGTVLGKSYQGLPIQHFNDQGAEITEDGFPVLLTLKDGRDRETIASIKHAEGYQVRLLLRTMPLRSSRGEIIGAVQIMNENRALVAVYENSRKTQNTVLFDPLTGIGNRPHIEGKIKFALDDYHQNSIPFGILFLDIDHFKNFNDTHGHLTGDKILRVVAKTIRNNLRGTDSCGRWGGEEFIALVFDLEKEGLFRVAEKLRQAILQASIEENHTTLNVKISIGATLVHSKDTFQTLVERADRLMYQSKKGGGNQVSIGD